MGLELDDRGVLLRCSNCGQRNRLPFENLERSVRCGKCKTAIPSPAQSVSVQSDAQFEQLVRNANLPVLVDFWAEWCGPCKMVAPELEKVAAQSAGKLLVAKVNTEDLHATSAQFQIASIPTMVLLRKGNEIGRLSGARPARDILAFVEQRL